MKLSKNEYELIIKVAKLKFIDRKQQKEIAELLKISQVKVSRILNKAIDLNLIKFRIEENFPEITELERAIEKKFKINRVILVRTDNYDLNVLKQKIGERAADFLVSIISEKDVIGISHGSTVTETVKSLPMVIKKQVDVVQILGGSYGLFYGRDVMDLTKIFSDKFNIKNPKILYAPLLVDNSAIKEAIMSDSNIRNTISYFKSISIALVGIGAFNEELNSSIFKFGTLSKSEINELIKNKIVGDVFANYYDLDGKFFKLEVNKRTIAISIENFLKIKYRLGVACGINKLYAIYGALKGNTINYLVTDTEVGKKLMEFN